MSRKQSLTHPSFSPPRILLVTPLDQTHQAQLVEVPGKCSSQKCGADEGWVSDLHTQNGTAFASLRISIFSSILFPQVHGTMKITLQPYKIKILLCFVLLWDIQGTVKIHLDIKGGSWNGENRSQGNKSATCCSHLSFRPRLWIFFRTSDSNLLRDISTLAILY